MVEGCTINLIMAFGGEIFKPGSPEEEGYAQVMSSSGITETPDVFIDSAEGETAYAGVDADPDGSTRRFLDDELAKIGRKHPKANAGLRKRREGEQENRPTSF